MAEQGAKLDKGKPRLSLIPKEALYAIARALGYGADKPEYGRDNFKKGLRYTRLVDAVMRHIEEFLDCKEKDEDSGLNPLDHALAALAMLAWMYENRKDMDDRYKKPIGVESNEFKELAGGLNIIEHNLTDDEVLAILNRDNVITKTIIKPCCGGCKDE